VSNNELNTTKSIVRKIISLSKWFLNYIAKLLNYNSAEEFLKHVEMIENGINEFNACISYEDYFSGSKYDNWFNNYKPYHQHVLNWFGRVRKIPGLEKIALTFDSYMKNGKAIREDYNTKYVDKMLDVHKEYFNRFGKNGLTQEQRIAVI
ncbi:uncharacterized protein METZ01_LOCUS313727, partial [marine metagenome]